MGLKTFTIDFAEFSQETLVRSNYKTVILGIEIKKHIQKTEIKFIRLKEYFDIASGFAFKSADYVQEGLPLIRIGDVGNDFDENNMVFLPEDYKEDYQRFLLKKDDIVVSLTGDGKLKSDFILESDKYLLNQRVGSLRAKENINVLFFYYLINYYSLTSKQFYWWSNGKTQLNISPFDLLKIKIPLIPKPKQDQIVAQIEPIEKKIKELKAQITPPQKIINKVFAKEFGFDLGKFEESKKEKFFEVDFANISKNNLTRVSSHFHHIKLNFLENKLKDKDFWISLNSKFKLSGGKRVPKGKTFSNEPTDYYYLRPTEINIWGIDKNNVLYISEEIYNKLKRYKITTGEFCISIVGTLGKTALINTEELEIEDDNLILSENFIKLKPIQEINDLFYYYYFYSFIFEAQMDREYTITSIKKLGIDKWNYIKIPNIPLKDQQKIVDEIKAELDKQEEIKSKIENERNKIDEIIEKAIK